MRWPVAGALACALAFLAPAAPAAARPHAVILFLPPGPGEQRPLLDELSARGLAIGMTSPTVGGFNKRQMGLDMSQGTRIPTRLYSKEIGALRLRGGTLTGWDVAVRRAKKAPGDLRPGLLAQTILDAGGSVGWSGSRGRWTVGPILAADERGRVSPRHKGGRLLVVDLPPGRAGLHSLDRILAARGRDDFVYVVRAPYGDELRLLPSGIAAPGIRGQLRSATTRRDGLIAATDVAPTVLDALGIPVPDDMQGQRIEGRGRADRGAVQDMTDRLAVVTARRGDALRWILGSWLVLLALLCVARGRDGMRAALRIGFLAVLWLPGVALLLAALAPSRLVEAAALGLGALALGAATDRLVRWPAAPAVPAAVVFVAHTIDLASGSTLTGRSLAGPNPAGGARFFGIGNELECMLSVSVLIGTGAALAWRARRGASGPRAAPIAFGVTALIAAGVMGAGRLGADVGAVITLGAGGAAAVLAALPGRPSRRAIALGIAAPVAAIGALILVDLASGGGAHLTRSVLQAHGSGDLADVVRRRFEGSVSTLKKPGWAVSFVIGVGAMAWLAARHDRLLRRVPREFAAGLVGAWVAVVIGAASNDSGPLILEIGAVMLLLAAGYASSFPRARH
ncbi:MAG: hypothetical protein ACJ77Z_19315 [Thermoleophilaceae bacterium]